MEAFLAYLKASLTGILLIMFGLFFLNLCFDQVGQLTWPIFDANKQAATPAHSAGEDLSQFILSLLVGFGGVCVGAMHLYFEIKSRE